MPYKARTASGSEFDFEFPLHPETDSAVNVANLLNALLETLDREIGHMGRVGNGDVLQALAMALAVRTRMLPDNPELLATLSQELLSTALKAQMETEPKHDSTDPGTGKTLH